MKFKVSDHILVPPHRILDEQEERKVLEKYGDKKNFPKIRKDDAAIKDLSPQPGNIVEITRTLPNGTKYKYYRVVIEK
jgi:DNA-directed RNA polymerase subunit H